MCVREREREGYNRKKEREIEKGEREIEKEREIKKRDTKER